MIKNILLLLVVCCCMGAGPHCWQRHQIVINNPQPVAYYQQINTYQFVPTYWPVVYPVVTYNAPMVVYENRPMVQNMWVNWPIVNYGPGFFYYNTVVPYRY
jgi:hypothetical protein